MENIDLLDIQELKYIVRSLVHKYGEDATNIVNETFTALRRSWMTILPSDLVSTLFSVWLRPKDISRLDSAFCARSSRMELLQIFSKGNVVLTTTGNDTEPKHLSKFLTWLRSRNISIECLYVIPETLLGRNCTELLEYLNIVGKHLKKLIWKAGESTDSNITIQVLRLCPNLTSVSVIDPFASAELIDLILSTLKFLHSLDLSISPHSDAAMHLLCEHRWADIENVCIGCLNLSELCIRNDRFINDDHVIHISRACPNLRVVDLSNSANISQEAVLNIAQTCPNLTSLTLDYSTALTDTVLYALAANCRSIQVLSANESYSHVTDAALLALLSVATCLTSLSLSSSTQITDACFVNIHEKCPELRLMQIDSCRGLTPAGVLDLIRFCPKLESLNIMGFSVDFDNTVRRELYANKLWLGKWKDRKLRITQSSNP